MTTTDYLLNALFLLVVLRQARERRLDLRSLLFPLVAVALVAHAYVHAVPTAGNDIPFVALLACSGVGLGVAAGLATGIRVAPDGSALTRLGWTAALLLAVGVSGRMAFAFAVGHGAGPAVRAFSIDHGIGAAAWPVALVSMAICEVVARVGTVALRRRIVCAG